MRQWFGVSANAVLNTHWAQFINHANYKIIDSNVMDCANVTKIPIDSPICQKVIYPPPPRRACAVQRQFRDREWRAIESHCWHRREWWKCVFCVSWTLNINAWDPNCLFTITAQCLMKTRTVREWTSGKKKKRRARRALYFSISPANLSSNYSTRASSE